MVELEAAERQGRMRGAVLHSRLEQEARQAEVRQAEQAMQRASLMTDAAASSAEAPEALLASFEARLQQWLPEAANSRRRYLLPEARST